MNFLLTQEQQMLKDSVRKFADNELIPKAEEIDREDKFDHKLWKKMADLQILGMSIPEEFGGAGLDTVSCCIIEEEISRGCGAMGLSFVSHAALCSYKISKDGNEQQKKKYLPDLASGNKIGALAMTEPGSGSDVFSLKTTAVKKGDKYILNGTKTFITNSKVADTFVVYAKTKDDALSAFILEKGFKGFEIGRSVEKLGMRGSPTGELIFTDCEVPAENLMRKEGEGKKILMDGLDYERCVISNISIGVSQACLEESVKYAKERKQFGKCLGEFEFVQGMLADMAVKVETARLLTHKTAFLIDQGKKVWKEAAMAKLYAADTGMQIGINAVQIFGGYGYTKEFKVERLMRDAKMNQIGAGTSEIMKTIIGRCLVKE